MKGPKRIVCMTEETTETLYLLGEQERIVGISGFTVRPPEARKEKPKVSAFISANIDSIVALKPDLVLGYSDLQADIAAALIRRGIAVHVFTQHSISGILEMIWQLGQIVDASARTQELLDRLQKNLDQVASAVPQGRTRPKVYFEEWDEPQIVGSRWISELIEIAGGDDVFKAMAQSPLAKGRILANPEMVISLMPDIILASWCGKKFRPERVITRQGWAEIPAVHGRYLTEIKSPLILQPGPAALTDGLQKIQQALQDWFSSERIKTQD